MADGSVVLTEIKRKTLTRVRRTARPSRWPTPAAG
jgi:hypothetical protein